VEVECYLNFTKKFEIKIIIEHSIMRLCYIVFNISENSLAGKIFSMVELVKI
jgi:hypothetical protein